MARLALKTNVLAGVGVSGGPAASGPAPAATDGGVLLRVIDARRRDTVPAFG